MSLHLTGPIDPWHEEKSMKPQLTALSPWHDSIDEGDFTPIEQLARINNKRLRRIRNWKHAGLILLALPLVVICAVTGIVFMPAFFGLRALTRIEYDF